MLSTAAAAAAAVDVAVAVFSSSPICSRMIALLSSRSDRFRSSVSARGDRAPPLRKDDAAAAGWEWKEECEAGAAAAASARARVEARWSSS